MIRLNLVFNIKDVQCPPIISNLCNYGSACMINLASNHVTCECDINCEIFDPMLLCGSDGVTYESLCHLKQTKCLQQRPIKIVNHDTCGKLEKFTFCFFFFIY